MTSALIASWAAIALLALVVSGLVRQVHQLSRGMPASRTAQRHGVQPGAEAPGAGALLGEGHQGGVLLFLSEGCGTCTDVLAEARHWTAGHGAEAPPVHALYAGRTPEDTVGIPATGDRADLFTLYDAIATPYAVLVDEAGRVLRSEPLGSATALPELLDDAFPRQARSAR